MDGKSNRTSVGWAYNIRQPVRIVKFVYTLDIPKEKKLRFSANAKNKLYNYCTLKKEEEEKEDSQQNCNPQNAQLVHKEHSCTHSFQFEFV